MSATKKIDFINGAYSQMRISGLTINPSPEDIKLALMRLENSAYEWEVSRNICTNYNFEENPDANSLTNVSPEFNHFYETNLAIRLIPDFNKTVPAALLAQASQSASAAAGISMMRNRQQVEYPKRMPIGSGNSKKYRSFYRYYNENQNPPNECKTNTIYVDDINDYSESYDSYLNALEDIETYTITTDPGLLLIEDSISGPVITYRIKAQSDSNYGSWQQVKIVINTTDQRVNTRIINFKLVSSNTVGGAS